MPVALDHSDIHPPTPHPLTPPPLPRLVLSAWRPRLQRKEREGLVFEIQEETSDLNVAAAPADVPTIRGPGRKSKREPAAHIGDGKGHEMKLLSTQIQAEMQARVALLETPLAFNEALAVMLGLASCHLPKETDETELLRLVAEQAARLQDRAREGPSFLLRESCSPALVKVRSACPPRRIPAMPFFYSKSNTAPPFIPDCAQLHTAARALCFLPLGRG